MATSRKTISKLAFFTTLLFVQGCQANNGVSTAPKVSSGGSGKLSVKAATTLAIDLCVNGGPRFERSLDIARSKNFTVVANTSGNGANFKIEELVKQPGHMKLTRQTSLKNGFRTCKLALSVSTPPSRVQSEFLSDPRVKKKPIGKKSAFTYQLNGSAHHVDFRGPYSGDNSSIVGVLYVVSQVRK